MRPLRRAAHRRDERLHGAGSGRGRARAGALELAALAARGRRSLLAAGKYGSGAAGTAATGLLGDLARVTGRPTALEVVAARHHVVARALGQVGPVIAKLGAEARQRLLLALALELLLDLVADLGGRAALGARDGVVEALDRLWSRRLDLEDERAGGSRHRALHLAGGRREDRVVEIPLEGPGHHVRPQPALVL